MIQRKNRAAGLPNDREESLLKAALLSGLDAVEAWKTWTSSVDLEHDLVPGERRILPLAYSNLTSNTHSEIPKVSAKIVELYKITLYHNNILLHNLLHVLDMLDAIDVKPIVMKGTALILSGTYSKIGTRVLVDYDILVPFDRKRQVFDFFNTKSFKPLARWSWYLEPFHQVHSIELTSDQFGSLDLHWFPISVNKTEGVNTAFFSQKKLLQVANRKLLITIPELQFVQAIVHGLQNDASGRTQWVCDAIKLMERYPSMDWDRVAKNSEELRVGAFVRHGTEYLAETFEGLILEEWLLPIRRIRVSRSESRIFSALNKPRTGMWDLLFLKKFDLQQHRPDRSFIYYWWTLFRYWHYAAQVSSKGSIIKEFLTAVRHLLSNSTYDMGSYRKSS